MVVLKAGTGMPDDQFLYQLFSHSYARAEFGKTFAIYSDAGSDTAVIFAGKRFRFDDGLLVGGQLQSVKFVDSEGTVFAKVTQADFNLGKLDDSQSLSGFDFISRLFAGNDGLTGTAEADRINGLAGRDIIKGSGGDDWLDGYFGKDIYTGGSGSDVFYIGASYGNDVIRDFDGDGGGDQQDYLANVGGNSCDFRKAGKNVIAEFENGTTITFLNAKIDSVNSDDFM